ncbi:MAG TPA: hypothetical protein VHN15_07360, partial [Thermoanaerobaculia bacterium]|nr:hypothetical protein [Thermoanaerobaculia bacterium]
MRTFHKAVAVLSLAAILLPAAAFAQAQASPQPLSPQEVLEYLARNRRDSALVSYTATPEGRPDLSDPAVFYNADQPMPL